MQHDPFRHRVATEQKRDRVTVKDGPSCPDLLASLSSAYAASQTAIYTTSAHPITMSTSSHIMLAFVLSTLLLGGNVALGKPADSRRARVARQVADPRRMPVPYSQTGTDLWGLDVIIQTADGNTDTAPAVGPNCNPVLGELLFPLSHRVTRTAHYACPLNRGEVWLQEASGGRGLDLSVQGQ